MQYITTHLQEGDLLKPDREEGGWTPNREEEEEEEEEEESLFRG